MEISDCAQPVLDQSRVNSSTDPKGNTGRRRCDYSRSTRVAKPKLASNQTILAYDEHRASQQRVDTSHNAIPAQGIGVHLNWADAIIGLGMLSNFRSGNLQRRSSPDAVGTVMGHEHCSVVLHIERKDVEWAIVFKAMVTRTTRRHEVARRFLCCGMDRAKARSGVSWSRRPPKPLGDLPHEPRGGHGADY